VLLQQELSVRVQAVRQQHRQQPHNHHHHQQQQQQQQQQLSYSRPKQRAWPSWMLQQ
jgi:hypothetical protein